MIEKQKKIKEMQSTMSHLKVPSSYFTRNANDVSIDERLVKLREQARIRSQKVYKMSKCHRMNVFKNDVPFKL